MKIIAALVISQNFKLTNGTDGSDYTWVSDEDQKFFSDLMKENNLILMGSKSYDDVKERLNFKKEKLRIVMTKNPSRYANAAVEGKLEFSNQPPKELVKNLEKRGFSQMLVTGGAGVMHSFLESNLIDEIYLTLEPVIFEEGVDLQINEYLNRNFELMEQWRLNEKGTILLRYVRAVK